MKETGIAKAALAGRFRLNLGCGLDVLPGWVNVDAVQAHPSVEVWDLEEMPWPFEDMSASEIRAVDVFEHIEPKLRPGFIVQCHRILTPGGYLRMQTAHYTCMDAYTDPTHYGAFTEYSFDFWIPGTIHYRAKNPMYGGVAFERVKTELNPGTGQLDVVLRRPNA